jgi:hypothetical protein
LLGLGLGVRLEDHLEEVAEREHPAVLRPVGLDQAWGWLPLFYAFTESFFAL